MPTGLPRTIFGACEAPHWVRDSGGELLAEDRVSDEPGKGEPVSTSAAARLLIEEMQRERRSFWGILSVFFLLLTGVGALIIYTTYKVTIGEQETQREQFASIGKNAEALTGLLNQQNTVGLEQKRQELERIAAQKLIGINVAARNGSTIKFVPIAIDYAGRHFLGQPLNMSSASVAAGVLEEDAAKAAAGPQAVLLLQAALADWTQDEAVLAPLARRLANMPAEAGPYSAYGHAALAGIAFRKSQPNGSAWDQGCSDVVAEVEAAQAAGALELARENAKSGAPEATGLNLDYWQGQCLRRHGESRKALAAFERMLTFVQAENSGVPDTSVFKRQAFHGAGTVMTAAIDEKAMTPEDKAAYIATARGYLEKAAQLNFANGGTEAGAFGSEENIVFLLFREDEPERLIDVLEHTGRIDAKMSMTWSLVARLAAARALLAGDFPNVFARPEMQAQYNAMKDKYSDENLKRILFETKAKLSQRALPGLAQIELKKLMGEEFASAVDIAAECVKLKEGCFDLDVMKAGAKKAEPKSS